MVLAACGVESDGKPRGGQSWAPGVWAYGGTGNNPRLELRADGKFELTYDGITPASQGAWLADADGVTLHLRWIEGEEGVDGARPLRLLLDDEGRLMADALPDGVGPDGEVRRFVRTDPPPSAHGTGEN